MPSCTSPDLTTDSTTSDSCLVPGRVLDRRLPGRAAAAAMVVDGELWVIVDLTKDQAMTQAHTMLTDPQTINMVQATPQPAI